MKKITNDSIELFTFTQYRKVGTTRISDQLVPAGTKVQALEGEYTCAEPTRIAIDASGNVYPVANSIFLKSYEIA